MGPRGFLTACFVALAAANLVAVACAVWLIEDRVAADAGHLSATILIYGGAIAFVLVAFVAVLWAYLDMYIAQPIASLVRSLQTAVYANPDHRIEVDRTEHLGGLTEPVVDLVHQLAVARTKVDAAVNDATAKIEAQKRQLETILHDLHEGVLVCNLNHAIMMYNNRALELLHVGGQLGLDRSLFSFTNRQPILHALGRLTNRLVDGQHEQHPDRLSAPFICATTDGRHTLEGRLGLMLDSQGAPTAYVITFEDKTAELTALGLRDRLLREATEGLRGPVGALRAAAEILVSHPEMPAADQVSFKQVLLNEINSLSGRVEAMTSQYRDVISSHWPTTDIYTANLFNNLLRRLRDSRRVEAVMTGIPQWLHGDSYTLTELLERLIHRVADRLGVESFDLEAVGGEHHVYLDVIWRGEPIQSQELEAWLEEELKESFGRLTLREVLEHHKTDIWSLAQRPGYARLRLPLPPALTAPDRRKVRQRLPARPEFYDFDLLIRPAALAEVGDRSLRSLTYVVFDTETTGLQPSAGDEIVSIAGVRIVNGRILTGESFERIVDPGRVIPRDSVKYHGITDDMVKDKPPIQVVLPQFHSFVGEAVLVAHNAAFDLKFLKLKEAEAGVVFDQPVLDTLLLSVFIHDHTPRHNLEAVAERFGIDIRGRHSALGDALVTAGVFLKMLDVLEARGVRTLNQALDAGNSIVEVRAKQAQF